MINYFKKHLPSSIKHLPLMLTFILALLIGCGGDNGKDIADNKVYYCPMHPEVQSDKPGVCPICHMDLVLKGSDETMDDSVSGVEGSLSLSSRKQVLANISTVKVVKENIFKTVNAYSYLDFAEQNRKLITARFNGRIEKLHVDRTGGYVSKGEPLFEIYSPDLVQAQNEYLIAMNGSLNGNTLITANGNNQNQNSVMNSSRQKLLLYGLTEQQINELEVNKIVALTLTYFSPFSGTIIEKKVQEGMYVNEGTVIYDIADLSTIWSIAEIFEGDLNIIKSGSKVQLELNSYPGETFTGTVNLIYPVINSETRTVKIRSTFSNAGNKLKPNMYGVTTFSANLGSGIVVPGEAVLFTGQRNLVWVKVGDKTFEPRVVKTGAKFDGKYQILSGLNEGEVVASSGAYLIDSESQLKSGLSAAGHQGHEINNEELKINNDMKDEQSGKSSSSGESSGESLSSSSGLAIWNEVCPVLGGKINPKVLTVNYKGKTIGFCCAGCDKDFKAEPEKFLANLSKDGKHFIGE